MLITEPTSLALAVGENESARTPFNFTVEIASPALGRITSSGGLIIITVGGFVSTGSTFIVGSVTIVVGTGIVINVGSGIVVMVGSGTGTTTVEVVPVSTGGT